MSTFSLGSEHFHNPHQKEENGRKRQKGTQNWKQKGEQITIHVKKIFS